MHCDNFYHCSILQVERNLCLGMSVKNIWASVFSWTSIGLNSFFPFTVILVLNCFIISTIRQRGKYFKKQQADSDTKVTMQITILMHYCYESQYLAIGN